MNNTIFFSLHNLAHQSPFFDWLVLFFANPFIYVAIFTAFVLLSFYTHHNFNINNLSFKYNPDSRIRNIFFVFSSTVFAWVITDILKSVIAHPRPFIVFENLKPLFLHGGMDSFPSGHATFMSALALSMYFVNKKVGMYFMVGAILVGLSRIIGGVHFPIDILFGYIIGTSVALIFSLIFKHKITDRLFAIFTKKL